MTKMWKSGEANQSPVTEDFLSRGDVYAGAYETPPSAPLIDDGSGKRVILRRFDFELPPYPVEQRPTKEKLLQFHKSKILVFLWKDELEPIEEFKITIAKNYKRFRIFVKCKAKQGSLILKEPLLLQQVANANGLKRD